LAKLTADVAMGKPSRTRAFGSGSTREPIPTPLRALFGNRPPGWIDRCHAGEGLDLRDLLLSDVWPLQTSDSVRDRRRCRSPLCAFCWPSWYQRRVADLISRLKSAVAAKAVLVVITLTLKSVDLSRLAEQIDALMTAWRKSRDGSPFERLAARHGIVGSLWALHPEFSNGMWHAHLHVVVAVLPVGSNEAQTPEHLAATMLGDRYRRFLERQGFLVVPQTIHVSDPLSIEAIARYFPDIWKAMSTKGGGVYALLRAALAGDEAARQAYVELAYTLHRRSLIRGSGILRGGG
jgi:hypothetical protein